MSEERLERIETTVQGLVHGQEHLRAGLHELRADVGVLREELGARIDALADQSRDLRTHMGVLHEEIIDRIKAIADPSDQLRREMRAGDDAVRESCGRRLDVIEIVVKDHAAQLKPLREPRRG